MRKFEKVSFEEFSKAINKHLGPTEEKMLQEMYDNIKLPQRKTAYSAGYDFYPPALILLNRNQRTIIPTGIKVALNKSKYLGIVPRSSYGIKHGMEILNTIGVIDADYYNNSDNEGHIFIAVKFDREDGYVLDPDESFAQGIISSYWITDDDECEMERSGGIGSTSI